jgi:hypothetical protein
MSPSNDSQVESSLRPLWTLIQTLVWLLCRLHFFITCKLECKHVAKEDTHGKGYWCCLGNLKEDAHFGGTWGRWL